MTNCQWCGNGHVGKCHLVKAIEYYPDGTVKRVEFFAPNDQCVTIIPQAQPLSPIPRYPLATTWGPAS